MATSVEDLNNRTAFEEQRAVNDYKIWQVIGASAAGTMIEWYDFYIFGSLTAVTSGLFYPPEAGVTLATIMYLSTFAVGFLVRPFGAVFFGRIGDLVGRKYAFLVTLLIMGGATAAIGFLPTYASIGILAPVLLLVIRILQGLALGGEYGGAAIYVAEHVPDERRGFYTSFIQITATLGLFISLAVILIVQSSMSPDDFKSYGWRIPFLISIFLVVMSLYIRLKMKESPIFSKLKKEGKTSDKPLADSLGSRKNWGLILLALFGATMGQGVIWYTGQFYALFYLTSILVVDPKLTNYIIGTALILGMPFFVIFGWLSDRIGRKWIMMAGCLLAVISYYPIYQAMNAAARSNVVTTKGNTQATGAISLIPYTNVTAPDGKVVQSKVALVGAKQTLPVIGEIATAAPSVSVQDSKDGVPVTNPDGKPKMVDRPAVLINGELKPFAKDAAGNTTVDGQIVTNGALPNGTAVTTLHAGPPSFWWLTLLVFIQVIFVTMVYGPIAAFLVEFFPAKVRYTSLSLPYHLGNGVFGGLLPLIGLYICASTGNIYYGLLYPIIVAAITLIVGSLFLPETKERRIWDELESTRQTGGETV